MNTLQLGDAFDRIAKEMPGRLVPDARVIDVEETQVYTWADLSEVFDMGEPVAVRDEWLKQGAKTGVFLIQRLGFYPVVVYVPEGNPPMAEGLLPDPMFSMVTVAQNGHVLDMDDMTWTCECGSTLEIDAATCPECGADNPFLGTYV